MNRTGRSLLIALIISVISICIPSVLSGQEVSATNFSGAVGSGARAWGMGGAFIAIADDATAASWNPGGLGQLESPEFSLVLRRQEFRNQIPAMSTPQHFEGPNDFSGSSYSFDFFSFTYPIRLGKIKIVPQISYQRAFSYDIDTTLNDVRFHGILPIEPNPFPSRISGFLTSKENFRGGFDNVTISLGSRLFDWLCVGISGNLWINGYEGNISETLEGGYFFLPGQTEPTRMSAETSENLTVRINGFNFNIGVLAILSDKLKIGAVYKCTFSAGSDIDVDHQLYIEPENITEYFQGHWSARVDWPDTLGLGIAYSPIDTLTLSLDFTSTHWSDSIMMGFSNEHLGVDGPVYFPTFLPVREEPKDDDDEDFLGRQLDTQQVRFGMEYVFIGQKVLVPLRLGFFSDTQYFSDSSGGRVTFFGITAGVGVKKGKFGFDAAAVYEFGSYLRSNFDYDVTNFGELRLYLSAMYSL